MKAAALALLLVPSVAFAASKSKEPDVVKAARRAVDGQVACLGLGTNCGDKLSDVGFTDDGAYSIGQRRQAAREGARRVGHVGARRRSAARRRHAVGHDRLDRRSR